VYGILISFSILIGILLAEKIIKKDKKDPGILWNLSLILITSGILGARSYHIIDYWRYYSINPLKILYIWDGGLGIYGAILLGGITSYTYLKLKKQDTWYYLSTITVFLPLGQSIGRWGNYFNKEVYGKITTLPWGIYVNGIRHHPLFLYESIGNILLFMVLLKLKLRGNMPPQKIIGLYLAGYGVLRFFLEFLKETTWEVHNLNIAQLVSIIFIGFSYILISKKEPAQ